MRVGGLLLLAAAFACAVGCITVEPDTAGPLLDGVCEASGPSQPMSFHSNEEGRDGNTALVFQGDQWTLVAERSWAEGTELATWTSIDEGVTWTAGEPLALVDDVHLGNVSAIELDGRQWLYFQSARTRTEVPTLWRAPVGADGFGPVEPVRPLLGVQNWDSRPLMWSDGGAVWVAYRGLEGRPALAVAVDGFLFSSVDPPIEEPTETFIVGTFGDGAVIAVWEDEDGIALLSQAVDAGRAWSTPRNVSSQFSAVHDVRLLFVERGRLDMYYRLDEDEGSRILRRPVFSAGGASPEQALESPGNTPLGRPVAHRLPDCRVLLSAVGTPDSEEGSLGISILDRDAVAE